MFQHIMVPLDGSELAERALPAAQHLAASSNATLHLVRVVEPPAAIRSHGLGAPVNVYEGVIAGQREEAATYLEEVRARIAESGRPVQVRQLDGDTASAILDYVSQAAIDMVVMTTHGRSGLTRWMVGSVADRVVHGGAPAVLLLNPDTADPSKRS